MPTPEPVVVAAYTAFTAALAVAAVSDIRTRRIPNVVVGPLLVAGIGVGGALGGLNGVASSFAAAAVGLAIWLPLYMLRAMGAGDVKLFAAASAWLSVRGVVEAALLAAVVGGLLAVIWFVRAHGARFAAVRLTHAAQEPRILRDPLPVSSAAARLPYGVAMAIAVAITAWRFQVL